MHGFTLSWCSIWPHSLSYYFPHIPSQSLLLISATRSSLCWQELHRLTSGATFLSHLPLSTWKGLTELQPPALHCSHPHQLRGSHLCCPCDLHPAGTLRQTWELSQDLKNLIFLHTHTFCFFCYHLEPAFPDAWKYLLFLLPSRTWIPPQKKNRIQTSYWRMNSFANSLLSPLNTTTRLWFYGQVLVSRSTYTLIWTSRWLVCWFFFFKLVKMLHSYVNVLI